MTDASFCSFVFKVPLKRFDKSHLWTSSHITESEFPFLSSSFDEMIRGAFHLGLMDFKKYWKKCRKCLQCNFSTMPTMSTSFIFVNVKIIRSVNLELYHPLYFSPYREPKNMQKQLTYRGDLKRGKFFKSVNRELEISGREKFICEQFVP